MATDIDGGAPKDTSPKETSLSTGAATLSPMSVFKRVNGPKTLAFEELSSEETSVYGTPDCPEPHQNGPIRSLVLPPETDEDEDEDEEAGLDVEEEEESSPKRQKLLSDLSQTKPLRLELPFPSEEITLLAHGKPSSAKTGNKKSKKKSKDVWSNTTSRKGKKKTKHAFNHNADAPNEDKVFITPIPRFPDKNDDSKDMTICLSKIYKAEKVELSEDRMSASSTKGYRMVRTNRGVSDGPWYFEIKVVHLGNSGHTRLGWSTEKGDLQAPVGYDGNSFGYRDIDGSKVHKALREEYGAEGYKEGDVIGFYINLPDGGSFVPNPPRLVWYKGQRYVCAPDSKEDPPKVVSGSEMLYYKNGVCQGVAFKDLYGGRYYPAASMYTLPNEAPCCVKFNFGPHFERFPDDFGERPAPRPMIEVPCQTCDDGRVDNGSPWKTTKISHTLRAVNEGGD